MVDLGGVSNGLHNGSIAIRSIEGARRCGSNVSRILFSRNHDQRSIVSTATEVSANSQVGMGEEGLNPAQVRSMELEDTHSTST